MSRSQRAPMCGSSNNDNIIHGKNSKDRGWVWNADTHGNSFGSIDRRHRWTVYIVFFILGCLIAAPRGACSFSSEALLLRSSSGLWNNHHRRGSLTMKCGTRRHGRNRNKNFQIATTTMALGFLDRNNNNNNADLNNQKNGKMLSFDAKSGTFAFSTGSLLRLSDRQRNALPNDSQRQWRLCAEPFKSEGFFDDVEKDGQPLDDDTNLDAVLALTTATTVNQPTSLPEPRRWADNKLYRQELSVTAEEGLHLIRPPTAPIYVSSSTKQRDNVGGYDPSEGISVKNPDKLNVGDPQVKLAEKEFSVNAILKELAAIQQQGPQKYCILGTRHCSFLHQQIIELLYVSFRFLVHH